MDIAPFNFFPHGLNHEHYGGYDAEERSNDGHDETGGRAGSFSGV